MGGGAVPIPHHKATGTRAQNIARLRLCPAVVLLGLMLPINDCYEPSIGSISQGIVWRVCQQLGTVPDAALHQSLVSR